MRDSARLRIAPVPAPFLALVAALLPLTGCPGAHPVQDARGATVGASSAGTGVRTTVEVRYYDVDGRSVQDILAAMHRDGPQWQGRRFFGLTNTTLQYGYRHAYDGERCAPFQQAVLVEVVVMLPRWRTPRNTPYDLERDWRAFDRALRQHEDGHRRLAEDEGATLDLELGRLRAPNCAALDTAAATLADAVRAHYGAEHASYDRHTEHGRSQGASWPRE